MVGLESCLVVRPRKAGRHLHGLALHALVFGQVDRAFGRGDERQDEQPRLDVRAVAVQVAPALDPSRLDTRAVEASRLPELVGLGGARALAPNAGATSRLRA